MDVKDIPILSKMINLVFTGSVQFIHFEIHTNVIRIIATYYKAANYNKKYKVAEIANL